MNSWTCAAFPWQPCLIIWYQGLKGWFVTGLWPTVAHYRATLFGFVGEMMANVLMANGDLPQRLNRQRCCCFLKIYFSQFRAIVTSGFDGMAVAQVQVWQASRFHFTFQLCRFYISIVSFLHFNWNHVASCHAGTFFVSNYRQKYLKQFRSK